MNRFISIPWWQRIIPGRKKTECLRLLQRQRTLLHTGADATAEIMDIFFQDEKVGNLVPVRLWVKLKKQDGSYVYTHTHSLVNGGSIPQKGQVIKMKYFPGNLSTILIL